MALIDIGLEQTSSATLQDFLVKLCDRLELEHAAYAGMDQSQGDIRGFVTYPEEWVRHYRENNLAKGDATLHLASRSIAPVDWSRIPRSEEYDRFLERAMDFGIPRNGVTVPVRGPFGDIGMLSVSMSGSAEAWARTYARVVPELQVAAVHVHDNVVRAFASPHPGIRPTLSAREVEILQWIAVGKTQRDIGSILAISDRTVEVHLRSARTKLAALTTAQAVARGIKARLIDPE